MRVFREEKSCLFFITNWRTFSFIYSVKKLYWRRYFSNIGAFIYVDNVKCELCNLLTSEKYFYCRNLFDPFIFRGICIKWMNNLQYFTRLIGLAKSHTNISMFRQFSGKLLKIHLNNVHCCVLNYYLLICRTHPISYYLVIVLKNVEYR